MINPEEVVKRGGDQDTRRVGDIEDNVYDYYLFFGTEDIGTVELCLNRNVMNTYFMYLNYLLKTKIVQEDLSPYYTLISVEDIRGISDFVNPSINNNRYYYQEGNFRYGIKVCYVEAPDFPIDL